MSSQSDVQGHPPLLRYGLIVGVSVFFLVALITAYMAAPPNAEIAGQTTMITDFLSVGTQPLKQGAVLIPWVCVLFAVISVASFARTHRNRIPSALVVVVAVAVAMSWQETAQAQINDLIMEFETGSDDLRGGNDNLNVYLVLSTGEMLGFDNVNLAERWGDNSSRTVILPLPDGLQFEDIISIRLETTFSGGVSGDNWNLNSVRATAHLGGEERELFFDQGSPLFEFTGDQRIVEFLLSPETTVPASPPVMTHFIPDADGFNFANNFTNIIISDTNFITRGLCGGMVYAALDYYYAGMPIPQQNYMPAEGTPLQSYIYDREFTSIEVNWDKWVEYGFNPAGVRDRELFNWGLQGGSGSLGELRERIDRGEPVPLGLISCGSTCGCEDADGCPGNHQVLAVGYEMGTYIGDLGANAEDLSIFVYDPNYPDDLMTLKPNVETAMYLYQEARDERWRAYFVDTNYSSVSPPVIEDRPNELIIEFETGSDDLRGGNDNLNVILVLSEGRRHPFDNVNDGERWVDNSSQTVSLTLPDHLRILRFEEIYGVRLDTTFSGGIGGDNWNLNSLRVTIRLGGVERQLFFDQGSPLFRFTGDQRTTGFLWR